jgi:hypothetical protein
VNLPGGVSSLLQIRPGLRGVSLLLALEAVMLLFASAFGDFTQPTYARLFVAFMWGGGAIFCLAAIAYARSVTPSGSLFWAASIGLRVAMLGCAPGTICGVTSGKGGVQNHGSNPYELSPIAPELLHLRDDKWRLINHPTSAAITRR